VIDERKIVALDVAIFVLPDFFAKQTVSSSATDVSNFIDRLPQAAICRHAG